MKTFGNMKAIKSLIKQIITKTIFAIKRNSFSEDVYKYAKAKEVSATMMFSLSRACLLDSGKINKYLYRHLSEIDRETLIRFYLKRFFDINTLTEEEKNKIDKAFEKADSVTWKDGNLLESRISFRGKELVFSREWNGGGANSSDSIKLMKYYPVAHTFFLIEYEKEGFNPKDGQIIFDCGAACGDTALLFETLYPSSTIHSFEFDVSSLRNLKTNIASNGLKNIRVVDAFLYSKSGDYSLDNTYNVIENESTSTKSAIRRVRTLAIDDYVKDNNITNIGLIKFDIEGGEQNALKGAVNTIKCQKPILYIPIYHLVDDIYKIPQFLTDLEMPMFFSIKWTEKKIWGMDCVLFVRFE